MSDVTFMVLAGGAAQIAVLLFSLFTTWALTATLRRRGMLPIQPHRASRSVVLHEIKYLSINLTASLLLIGVGARLGATGLVHVRLDRPTLLSAVVEIALYLAGLDVYTYAVHRLMHTRWLYRHVHSVHHRSRTPSALTAFSFHPVEWLLLGLYVPLSLVTFDYHAVTLAAVVAMQGFLNTLPHCGYELAPRGWYENPVSRLFATTFYHDLHHQRPTSNYGTITTLWDRLLGTVPADFEEQFAAMKDRASPDGVARAPRLAPGPRGVPLLGSALPFARDPRLALMAWAREHGPMMRVVLGPVVAHVVAHPEGVRHVLQTRADNYHKAAQTRFLTEFLGLSILTLEGDAWRRRRRLAQPAFHKERLAEIAGAMTGGAERMLARWQRHEGSGRSFDVAAEMMRVTLGVAGETLLGVDLGASAAEVGRALPVVLDHVYARSNSLRPLPLWVPTPGNRRYHEAKRVLDTMVCGLIQDWRSGRAKPTGLMAMIMDARDEETGERLGDEALRNEVMTLIFAGHETTASALSWTFWLLAQNPAAARRLRRELADVLGDRAPTAQDLPRLQYTANAVKEAMRLLPPAWVIGRSPLADDEIEGYHVPGGSLVLLAPCVTHRDPSLWDDPETFDPDRFTPERSAGRHRMAYYPFSDGPRGCIGKAFSMMEATLIVATVAQRYRLEIDRERPVEIQPSLTLRPKNGLWMKLRSELTPASPRGPAP